MDSQKPKPSELPPKKTISLDPAKAAAKPAASPPPAPPQTMAQRKTEDGENETGDGGGLSKAIKPALCSVPEATGDAENDLQKKLRRAERFGVPVQLSEVEKRNSRAERFGTGSGVNEKKNTEEEEKQKRKARAERFGIKEQTVSDEETKKKARSERFGSNTTVDSSEEEKRKARAIRFSQSSNTSTQGAGEIKPDLKATTVANN